MKLISSLAGSALAASVISVAGRTPLPTGVHEALSEVVTVEYGVDVASEFWPFVDDPIQNQAF